MVFAGSASRRLGAVIARRLGVQLGASEVIRFSEGNLFVRVLDNVRGRDVFIVQGTAFPANDNFMELLFWIDALNRASAASVTAVIPYFSYAKGDKKDEPRVSIRGRVCADAIQAAGVDHTESAEVVELIGEVAGRTALIVDDFTITAGTLTDAARVLVERGATGVYAAVSHALLTGPANERLDASPIRQLLTTDSVETQPAGLSAKVEVVSVGGLFAEAIRRIAARESVSVLFR
jgi:phosphoribosylpyrophosphate synthetase